MFTHTRYRIGKSLRQKVVQFLLSNVSGKRRAQHRGLHKHTAPYGSLFCDYRLCGLASSL